LDLPLDNPARLRELICKRLQGSLPHPDIESATAFSAVNAMVRQYLPADPIAAAVLLTTRASHLRHHAGQISFPGGRIEPTDQGPVEAALREAEEEIGLAREHVTPAGYLNPHLVVTGYWVTPVVGFVSPSCALTLDPREVESTFEVPLTHVLDSANHHPRERSLGNTTLSVFEIFEIPFGPYKIWGATAAMLMELYRVLAQVDG
jgi:8-oxo-dGTP pyrophosphatase MutT (NUDIX family)